MLESVKDTNSKIGIVILNYLNWHDTCELINSLFQQTFTNYEVIIVDNDSPNESIEILIKEYRMIKNIHVIKSESNLGFAKGNNLGIKFLKEMRIERILVMNNDVLFTNENYLLNISQLSYSKNVGAIGTKILGPDGLNQNPIIGVEVGWIPSIKSFISKSLSNGHVSCIKEKLFGVSKAPKSELNMIEDKKKIIGNEKIFIHGSVVFFTENFLKVSDGFYPGTFLFFEENILSIVFKKLNLNFMYEPSLSIYHKEDQSSAMAWGNETDIKRKYSKMSIFESFKVLSMTKSKLLKQLRRTN